MNEYNIEDVMIWTETAMVLSGKNRRLFMARVVNRLGSGGQAFAEQNLNWSRTVIRKGQRELNGEELEGDLSARGRKKMEEHYIHLLDDIKSILEPISQADPSFRSEQLYSPITAKEVLRRLIENEEMEYTLEHSPSVRTISNKIKGLGFRLRRVQKSKPLKKNP